MVGSIPCSYTFHTTLKTMNTTLRPLAFASSIALASIPLMSDSVQPNIILIVADDMGFSDIGSYGSEIETPHLDRLAVNGLRYRQFYNAARCCPSRASLLTGLYPHQTGMGNMVVDQGYPAYQGDLNTSCITIAEVLQGAGYRTIMSGKWHVTKHTDMFKEDLEEADRRYVSLHNWPRQRGFDRFFGTIHGAGSFFEPSTLVSGNEPIQGFPEDFYYTDAISDFAADEIRESLEEDESRPFFAYVAYTAPHWPLHARAEDIERFKGRYAIGWDAVREQRLNRMKLLGVVDPDTSLSDRPEDVPAWVEADNKDWYAHAMAVYAAQMFVMDEGIGRILEVLDEAQAFDNTLILFLSDNGGCAEVLSARWPESLHVPYRMADGTPVVRGLDPDHLPGPANTYASYGVGWANASNTPFTYYKHYIQEGGIATPLVVSWPEGLASSARGSVTDQVGHVKDLMPTLLDLSGLAYPETRNGVPLTPLSGLSLAGNFRGDTVPIEPLFWEHHGNRGVRQGKWKGVSIKNGPWMLYDVEKDRIEAKDLAGEYPERLKLLVASYAEWAESVGVVENPPKPLKH